MICLLPSIAQNNRSYFSSHSSINTLRFKPLALSKSGDALITFGRTPIQPQINMYNVFYEHFKQKREGLSKIDEVSREIINALGGENEFKKQTVLAAYGGGKDSTFMVGFIWFIQEYIKSKLNDTFNLRIVVNGQGGMLDSVYENIDRVFKTIGAYNNPKVQLLLVGGSTVVPFSKDSPLIQKVRAADGKRILLAGHLAHGDGRSTFCDLCNVDMMKAFDYGINGNIQKLPPASLIVTGDSNEELNAYAQWPKDVALRLGLSQNDIEVMAFKKLMEKVGNYRLEQVRGNTDLNRFKSVSIDNPRFFSPYRFVPYQMSEHKDILEKIGFRFDPDNWAVSFTESDCFHPAVMAHFFGLMMETFSKQWLGKQISYPEAVTQYVNRHIIPLMRRKHIPENIIDLNKKRYATPKAIEQSRIKVETLLKVNYGYSSEQIKCLVWSPFANQGQYLEAFINKEHPHLKPQLAEIDYLLNENNPRHNELPLAQTLEAISGLTLAELRHLYQQPLADPLVADTPAGVYRLLEDSTNPVFQFRVKDPHKRILTFKTGFWPWQTKAMLVTGR